MMLAEGGASRLTLFLHVDAAWHHHSLSDEIIQRALKAGLSGGSVFHGIEGDGNSGVVHTSMFRDIMESPPRAIVIVDPAEDRLRSFVSELGSLLDHGLVVSDTVEVARTSGTDTDNANLID